MSRLELSKHHALLQGTCQLEHPQKMTRYIPLLNEPLDDLPQNSKEDESEEEGLAEKFARPIIQPAFTSWSQEETEAFFHGLVRCSRFRPDAISEHIQTKSEAEVMALIDTLEEQSSLIKAQDIAPAETEPVPAAREMSDAWIAMEEQLAEDVVVWEAFVEQACRTPPSLRDSAQKAALRKYYNVSCLQCRAGVCDKEGPLCIGLSRATTSGLPNLTLTKDQAPE